MLPNEVKHRIEQGMSGAEVYVNEFSGGTDHYTVIVVSDSFSGVQLIKRHRMVMELFRAEVNSGEVHALSVKAYTFAQWEIEKKQTRFF